MVIDTDDLIPCFVLSQDALLPFNSGRSRLVAPQLQGLINGSVQQILGQ